MIKRSTFVGISLALMVAAAPALAQENMSPAAFLHVVNQNDDKTISQKEVDAYAAKQFDAINQNKDNTLSQKELAGRISEAGFKTANTDYDKPADHTISKAEFMSYVDRLFKEANDNPDGTLSVKELSTPAGEKLIRLLR